MGSGAVNGRSVISIDIVIGLILEFLGEDQQVESLVAQIVNEMAKSRGILQESSELSVVFCRLVDLEDHVEKAFLSGRTPIVFDSSPHDNVCTFYSYQPDSVILEVKSMIVDSARLPLLQVLEYARRQLVNAMKYGKLLVIRLGPSVPDFLGTLSDNGLVKQEFLSDKKSFFPMDALLEGGKNLISDEWAMKLFREEDMFPHKNFAYCLDTFRVILTSQLTPEQAKEHLFPVGGSELGHQQGHGFPGKENFYFLCVNYGEEDGEEGEKVIET